MRICILAALPLLLSACEGANDPDAKPDAILVERIEHWLPTQKCIGNIAEWERRYQFQQDLNITSDRHMTVSKDVIVFALRRGDAAHPIRPGRQTLPTKFGFIGEIDDRPGLTARGKLDVTSGRMTLDWCGFSAGG
jgi:hypothetical protein